MEPLSPIPVPRENQWREFRIRRIPLVVFFTALVVVIFIWKDNVAAPSFVGEVETIQANVISTLPGQLVEMNVDRFQKVSRGEVVGKVYPADPELLKASLATIEIELKTLQTRVALDEERNEVNYEQFHMDLLSQRVELATAKINLQFAENEFRRIKTLREENLVSQSEFELAENLRDARREEVGEKSKLISEMESRLRELSAVGNPRGIRTNSLSQAIAAQEAQLLLTEGPITLIAPMDGVVAAVHHRAGEKIMAGLPIVTITAPRSNRIVAFARQPLHLVPKVGDRVEISTRSTPRKTAKSTILQVGSTVEPMVVPANTDTKGLFSNALGNPMERGLAFAVALPQELALYPGETVDLIIVR
jgi:multidrug resistance efflux pump